RLPPCSTPFPYTTLFRSWILASSLKTNEEIYNDPFGLPSELRLGVYVDAWQQANIGAFFTNTVIVVSGGVVLTMLLSVMTAYVRSEEHTFELQSRENLVC